MNMKINLYNNNFSNANTNKNSSPKFKGHVGGEYYNKFHKYGIRELVSETAFFRQNDVLKISKNLLEKIFPTKSSFKILDGACSIGEETWTLAMLFNKNKNSDITGFDLSKNVIETAKKGKYTISKIVNPDICSPQLRNAEAFSDSYLAFPYESNVTADQVYNINLFKDYFTQTSKDNKMTLLEKIKMRILAPSCSIKSKSYEIKPEKANLCKFVQGDILNMDNLSKDGETDMILFRNALYHMVSDVMDVDGLEKIRVAKPKEQVEAVISDISDQLNKKLKRGGLFVLGNREKSLNGDINNVIPKTFEKKGFYSLVETDDDKYTVVWQKK